MAPANLSFSASLGSIASATSQGPWWSVPTRNQPFNVTRSQLGGLTAPWKCTERNRKERIIGSIIFESWKTSRGCFFGIRKFWDVKIPQRSFYFGILTKKLHHFVYRFLHRLVGNTRCRNCDVFRITLQKKRIHIPPNGKKGNHRLKKGAFFQGDILVAWSVTCLWIHEKRKP